MQLSTIFYIVSINLFLIIQYQSLSTSINLRCFWLLESASFYQNHHLEKTNRGHQKKLRPKQIRAKKRKAELDEMNAFQESQDNEAKFQKNWAPIQHLPLPCEQLPCASLSTPPLPLPTVPTSPIEQVPPIVPVPIESTQIESTARIQSPFNSSSLIPKRAMSHDHERRQSDLQYSSEAYSKWFEGSDRYRLNKKWILPCLKGFRYIALGDSHLKSFGKYQRKRNSTCIVSYSGADLGSFSNFL